MAWRTDAVVYVAGTALMARPFDANTLAFTGEAFPVADDLQTGGGGNSAFTVSSNGVVVYQTGNVAATDDLVWFDRGGRQIGRPVFARRPLDCVCVG